MVTYPDFTEKFEYGNFSHGVGFEIGGFTRNKMHVFTGWENKHMGTHGSGSYVKDGRTYEGDIYMKVRHNIFHTVGFGYKASKSFCFGFSPMDIGSFKVLFKDKKGEMPDEWQNYHGEENKLLSQHMTLGVTFYTDFWVGKAVRLRASYYPEYFRNDLGIPTYVYMPNAFNLQAALFIHKQ